MEMNERTHQLINMIAKTLLQKTISKDLENSTHLPAMLDGLGYVSHKIISQISHCEVQNTSSFDVIDTEFANDKIYISFEMPFTLTAWNSTAPILKITAIAEGTCSVPDLNVSHWDSLDFYSMEEAELSSRQNLAEIEDLYYTEVECTVSGNA